MKLILRLRIGDQLSYASGGNGTVAHLGMELFKHMAGVDIVHVPYKGTAAVVKALVTGELQASFAQMATGGISADDLKPSIARLTGMVERIDRALQDAPWLAGEEVSLADIDIAPFVQRLVRVDLFGLVTARPRVNDWYARMTLRPAYASAMPPAGSEGGQPAPA